MRLCQAKRGHVLASCGGHEKTLLLLFCAKQEDWHRSQANMCGKCECSRPASSSDLFGRKCNADRIRIRATICLGKRQPQQSETRHLREDFVRKLASLVDMFR